MPGYTGGDFARLFFSMREFPDRKKEVILTIVMDRLIGMLALVVAAVVTTGLRWQWLQQTPQASFLLWILLSMLIGFTVITVGSFLMSGLKLANRLPRHTPFRERLIETSEAYHVFARAKVPLLLGLSFVVSSSFFILRRILLRCSGGACARFVPRHDYDHADRHLHYFSADHAWRRWIS